MSGRQSGDFPNAYDAHNAAEQEKSIIAKTRSPARETHALPY